MKKLLSIGLALTMAASLAACGGGNSQVTILDSYIWNQRIPNA